MTYLLLQTFLLLLASYFFGAFLACLLKRTIGVRPAAMEGAALAPVAATTSPRTTAPVAAVKPRVIDPVQPKIDILPRPEPKPAPAITAADTERFSRALTGPDPNEGMPRKCIVEIRPAILKSPTGPAVPFKPKPAVKAEPAPAPAKPEPVAAKPAAPQAEPAKPAAPPAKAEPAPQPAPVISGAAAASAAAAAAVAAAKAAAAAIVTPAASARPAPAPDPAPVVSKPAEPQRPVAASPVSPATSAPAAQAATPAAPAAKPEPAAPLAGGDDRQRIRAIDAETERGLNGLGVRYFDNIAMWTAPEVERFNKALNLGGRIDREQWIEQAQILAKGGETYYSRNRAAAARDAAAAQTAKPSAPSSTPAAQALAPAPAAAASAPASGPTANAASTAATAAAAAAAAAINAASTARTAQPAAPQPAPTPAPVVVAPAPTASVSVQTEKAPAVNAQPKLQGRSVAEMATAAAAAIAAASASVTRGMRPIEPISPMSKADPNIVMPAKLSDAIREKDSKSNAAAAATAKDAPPSAARSGDAANHESGEDLKRIRGIGVLIEKRLNALGVSSYDDIANWTSGDIDRISQTLEFKGRIERENWIEQARILSSGGQTEFSRRVDRGDVESSKDPDAD